jgi:hypothetical protein
MGDLGVGVCCVVLCYVVIVVVFMSRFSTIILKANINYIYSLMISRHIARAGVQFF